VRQMFFDLHIHANPELAINAQKMGYSGMALVLNPHDYGDKSKIFNNIQRTIDRFHDDEKPNIKFAVEIDAKNPKDLKKQVGKFRKKVDVILVHGGDLKINRAATEDPRVDILSHPYRSRYDSGLNHVLAVKAAENKVSVEINLKYFLLTRPTQRYRVLSQFRQIMKLHRKYNVPVIITSDASSIYDLRHPKDVIALASCFGMTNDEAFHALSTVPQNILAKNEIRDQIIIPGVRLPKQRSQRDYEA